MNRSKTLLFTSLLAVFALVAAACGGDDAAEETTTTTTAAEAADEMGSIVDVAAGAGQFNTLLTAATAAGLADTLANDGPFTVFAPTDEAFAALPEGTLDALLEDPEALSDILLYHVVSGKVLAADVVGLTSATTLQGSDVTITVSGEAVTLDGANVTATDIEASNGVIHVIDAVILPPSA